MDEHFSEFIKYVSYLLIKEFNIYKIIIKKISNLTISYEIFFHSFLFQSLTFKYYLKKKNNQKKK